MSYTYSVDNNKYIIGWNLGGTETPPTKDMDKSLTDEHGNYKYQLIDGKIILNPQKPTTEQLEAKRKQYIVEEIRKKYTIDDELKILYRGTDVERKEHELCIEEAKKKWEAESGTATK